MPPPPESRDYPKLLTPALLRTLRDQDMAEAATHFAALTTQHDGSLELWA